MSDAFLPQMLDLERIGGVSFEKGCYVGQEIVARVQHLGRVKRRAYLARRDDPLRPGPRRHGEWGEGAPGTITIERRHTPA